MKRFGWVIRFLLVVLFSVVTLYGVARSTAPPLEGDIPVRTAQETEAAQRARDAKLGKPITLIHEADYTEGESARWYPKNESPILKALVDAGELPPVAQRVSSEPLVIQGVEGIGKYGGTWYRTSQARLGQWQTLVKYSPMGLPIVPNVAKSWTISADYRVFTFYLRRMHWWEHECLDPNISRGPSAFMKVKGELAKVQKLDDHTIRFTFPHPNSIFFGKVASGSGWQFCSRAAHYFKRFHPTLGDPDQLRQLCAERGFDTVRRCRVEPTPPAS